MDQHELDLWHMRRALELAALGQGAVEPNPMVGCVIARGAEIIGEGWHRRFGGDHTEIEALRLAGPRAEGATLYVTLEPCCHSGKTPPCTRAVLAARIGRVVAAMPDPFPEVAGRGIADLTAAGVEVELGAAAAEARRLNAPYLTLQAAGRPWIMAKWAMTLDGKIATGTGESRWISGAASRQVVHALRGRVDAVMVGRETAERDDPLLTARPPGPRTAVRIVLDGRASLSSTSQLARTARQTPVLVAAAPEAADRDRRRLEQRGCEVLVCNGPTPAARLTWLLEELGRRRMTNVLVEGGSRLFGSLLDGNLLDEVHIFIAAKLLGGAEAIGPIAGHGAEQMAGAVELESPCWQQLGGDLYVRSRIKRVD
jgi:diaminohydroxyphosphoribosylaminopyrimidine deaminase / 5-amino-6-(5-phosphoribosylamino)uracil reductase